MSRFAAPLAALCLALLLGACGEREAGNGADSPARLNVVTTLSVFEDFVQEIGGDRVETFALLPAGADPHTYEPTPRDIQRVTEADVIFANGLDLEPAALKLIEPNLPTGTPLVRLGEEAAAAGFAELGLEGEGNPHLWLSVDGARAYARTIRDALAQADPEGARTYNENYDGYSARLDELDRYVTDKLAALPAGRRKVVTTHDAFAYMAAYMRLEVAGVVVESPGQEPSAADVADLVNTIEQLGVPAVFEEPQLGPEASVLERAAEDAGVEVCTLYSDSLDERVPTYVDLMRHNADELARCLGGEQ